MHLSKNEMKRSYYNVAGVECEKIIINTNMNFSIGNAFKYLYRCNNVLSKGNILEDLNKAIYNLENAKKYSKNRIYNSTKYIELLDSSVFADNIWESIKCILSLDGGPGEYNMLDRDTLIGIAISYIKEELE